MLGLSKLVHLTIDAVLVSALLASIKRTSGITPTVHRVRNKDFRQFINAYLELGEWVLDLATVFTGRSSFFERRP